jgi:hypothetical protein
MQISFILEIVKYYGHLLTIININQICLSHYENMTSPGSPSGGMVIWLYNKIP